MQINRKCRKLDHQMMLDRIVFKTNFDRFIYAICMKGETFYLCINTYNRYCKIKKKRENLLLNG